MSVTQSEKCPKCKSNDWEVRDGYHSHCNNCGHEWPWSDY